MKKSYFNFIYEKLYFFTIPSEQLRAEKGGKVSEGLCGTCRWINLPVTLLSNAGTQYTNI